VERAGDVKQIELLIGQIEQNSAKGRGELRPASSVAGIRPIGSTARIVEEGEQRNDRRVRPRLLRQESTVFEHPRPVRNAVESPGTKPVLVEDRARDRR
jgi:hypothetical protein